MITLGNELQPPWLDNLSLEMLCAFLNPVLLMYPGVFTPKNQILR